MRRESSKPRHGKPTKNVSGSPIGSRLKKMSPQAVCRWACAGTTALAALLAWYGSEAGPVFASLLTTAAYWGLFVVLLFASLYLVVLDLRFIRLAYALEKRRLYQETLGSEEFRKSLLSSPKRDDPTPPSEQS